MYSSHYQSMTITWLVVHVALFAPMNPPSNSWGFYEVQLDIIPMNPVGGFMGENKSHESL